MKNLHLSFSLVVAISLSAQMARAAIVQLSDYRLGEAGSVGAAPTRVPLSDSMGVDNSLTVMQAPTGYSASIVSPGVGGSPNSTAALNLVQSPSRNAGWGGTANAYGLTDNWAFQLWFKTPDTTNTSQSYLLFGDQLSLELNNNKVNILTGTNIATRVVGFNYTPNTWTKITLMDYGNQVRLYNGATLAATAAMANSNFGVIRLGFGSGAPSNRGAAGTWDEMKVWSFASTDSLNAVENIVIHGIPEPGSFVLMMYGCALLWIARRYRKVR